MPPKWGRSRGGGGGNLNKTANDNEIIAIQLRTSSGYLLIASIYIPPAAQLVNEVFEELYQLSNDRLILGDLNASLQLMGSNRTNSKGRQLGKLLDEGYLQCADSTLATYTKQL
ncbi:unnamed protein product [Rotaria socialis]|uniref:Endonuclease/exonuclease/phosphatase domain-containing protein n=1 Tax=Rotaria socialis TaxID=392032 RepID=A0A818JI93_9BILA|nr:unnamed protein product [Rotaria socialis]